VSKPQLRLLPHRILIVDDHPIVREGLALRIGSRSDMEVCGEAEDVQEGLAQVQAKNPDLVIVDLSLASSHGLDLIRQIKARFSDVKILVVSHHQETLYAERCIKSGAHGYINKRECQEKIIDALRTVLQGKRYLSAEITERLINRAVGAPGADPASAIEVLTSRELQVFQLIGEGMSTANIARRLSLSPHTVDTHRERTKVKLNLRNAAELQRAAIEWVMERR
jgi:DNA-binding NarL/FixJ family response regulator